MAILLEDGTALLLESDGTALLLESDGATITVLRGFLPAKRPDGRTVDLRGTGGAWTPGTPGSPSFTVSGVAGCSKVLQVVESPTQARLVIATGATAGTLAISDGTSTANLPVKLVGPARGRWFAGLGR